MLIIGNLTKTDIIALRSSKLISKDVKHKIEESILDCFNKNEECICNEDLEVCIQLSKIAEKSKNHNILYIVITNILVENKKIIRYLKIKKYIRDKKINKPKFIEEEEIYYPIS